MRYYLILLITVAVVILIASGLWIWVLVSRNPLQNPAAQYFPWPVACTTRSCITTFDWQKEMRMLQIFAERTNKPAPAPGNALNTLVHQHLVHFGQLKNPVNLADARKYRENILNLKDENAIKEATGLSMDDYDKIVVTPFLEQEGLRQQLSLTSNDELFKKLAQQRFVLMLPFRLKWNRNAGLVQW